VREVAKRLGFERTWLVRLPAGVKDVNEFLVHGGTREQFAALKAALKKVSKSGRELRTADQEGSDRAGVAGAHGGPRCEHPLPHPLDTCSTVCSPKSNCPPTQTISTMSVIPSTRRPFVATWRGSTSVTRKAFPHVKGMISLDGSRERAGA
jgi:hypothetical protein